MDLDRKIIEKIARILTYVGLIGAVTMSIGYIAVVTVLIKGFQKQALLQTTIFSAVSSAVGFVIMQFLKYQGQSWAESLPENKKVVEEYNGPKVKNKKVHSISYFWATSVPKDIFFKVATLGLSSIGVIYLVVVGSNDWSLMLLAIFNLLMFICFGMVSCAKAYNFYNNEHIPYLKKIIYEAKVQAGMDIVEEECNKQGNDCMVSNSQSNLLEPSNSGVQPILHSEIENRDGSSDDLVSLNNTSDSDTSNPVSDRNSLRA